MKSLFFAGILCMAAQLNYAQSFDKQAHRGGKSLYPENTIPAMKNALKMGITTLEMDLAITKDRKLSFLMTLSFLQNLLQNLTANTSQETPVFITKSMICLTQRFRLMM